MPIRIPDALPATDILESENIFVHQSTPYDLSKVGRRH